MEKEIRKIKSILVLSYAAVILIFGPLFFHASIYYRKDVLERSTFVITFLLFVITVAIFIGYFAYINKMKKVDNGSIYNGKFSPAAIVFLAIISTAGQASFIFTGNIVFAVVVLISLLLIINKLTNSRIIIGQNYIVKGFKNIHIYNLKCIRDDENSGAVIEFHGRKPIKVKLDKESLDFINVMMEEKHLFQVLCDKYGVGKEV